jgi:hypothetical protein
MPEDIKNDDGWDSVAPITINPKEFMLKSEDAIEKLAKAKGGDPIFWHFFGLDVYAFIMAELFGLKMPYLEKEGEHDSM